MKTQEGRITEYPENSETKCRSFYIPLFQNKLKIMFKLNIYILISKLGIILRAQKNELAFFFIPLFLK